MAKSKSPQGAPARKANVQSNPAAQTLDKFGLMLTVLVLLGGALCLFAITNPLGLDRANTSFFGMGRGDAQMYNAMASDVKVLTLFNSGTLVHEDKHVDSAILDAGTNKKLRVGDALVMPGTGAGETIVFYITKVFAEKSEALILHSIKGDADPEGNVYLRSYLEGKKQTSLSRTWENQTVRKAVHEIRQ